MTYAEFRKYLDLTGIKPDTLADIFGVEPETVERWKTGRKQVPPHIAICLELLIKHNIAGHTSTKVAKDHDDIDGRVTTGKWRKR